MKLIEICEKETKRVSYFGIELTIDANVKFLATNRYGFVYGYVFRPEYYRVPQAWGSKCEYAEYLVARVDLSDKDWKDTLVEV